MGKGNHFRTLKRCDEVDSNWWRGEKGCEEYVNRQNISRRRIIERMTQESSWIMDHGHLGGIFGNRGDNDRGGTC